MTGAEEYFSGGVKKRKSFFHASLGCAVARGASKKANKPNGTTTDLYAQHDRKFVFASLLHISYVTGVLASMSPEGKERSLALALLCIVSSALLCRVSSVLCPLEPAHNQKKRKRSCFEKI